MLKYYFYIWSILLFTLLGGCDSATTELAQCMSTGKAEIEKLDKNYKAGEKIKLRVQTQDLIQENILIVWEGKFGEAYFEKKVFSDDFIFSFPDSTSIQSGAASVKIVHCNRILCKEEIYIRSLYPSGVIESYLGPKTLAIDENRQSMLCLFPTDKYGNALEVTDSVLFNTKYSGLPVLSVSKKIENMFSYLKIDNNQQVGKVLLGAKCQDTYIDEQEIAIVQGPMKKIKINIVQMHPYSDDRQTVHLNTDVIYDERNNVIADGTSVVYVIHEEGEVVAQYQTYTVSGIANVFIENPKSAALWNVSISGAPEKTSLELRFVDNIESIPLRIDKDFLVVGPVIGSLDQYIPDGTSVKVVFNYSIQVTSEIEHGFAKFKIKDKILRSEEVICEVEINGKKVKLIY